MAREYTGLMGIYWASGNILDQCGNTGLVSYPLNELIKLTQSIIIIIATWHSDVVVFTNGEEMFHLLHKLNL